MGTTPTLLTEWGSAWVLPPPPSPEQHQVGSAWLLPLLPALSNTRTRLLSILFQQFKHFISFPSDF